MTVVKVLLPVCSRCKLDAPKCRCGYPKILEAKK